MLGVAAAGQDDDVITGSAQIDPSVPPVSCRRGEATSHESAISNQTANKPSASLMLRYVMDANPRLPANPKAHGT
jgi:hypothetical protein